MTTVKDLTTGVTKTAVFVSMLRKKSYAKKTTKKVQGDPRMSISKTEAEAFYEKLNTHPKLKARIESLFERVENNDGDLTKAAEAEPRVREELRQMGHE